MNFPFIRVNGCKSIKTYETFMWTYYTFYINLLYILCKCIIAFTRNIENVTIICAYVTGYERYLSAVIDH